MYFLTHTKHTYVSMTDDVGMDAAGGLGTTMKTGVNEDIMSWKKTDHDDQLSPRRAVEGLYEAFNHNLGGRHSRSYQYPYLQMT